jgi:hypothetical protein
MLHGENDKTVDELVRKSEEWHTLTDYVDDDNKTHHVATTRMEHHEVSQGALRVVR